MQLAVDPYIDDVMSIATLKFYNAYDYTFGEIVSNLENFLREESGWVAREKTVLAERKEKFFLEKGGRAFYITVTAYFDKKGICSL